MQPRELWLNFLPISREYVDVGGTNHRKRHEGSHRREESPRAPPSCGASPRPCRLSNLGAPFRVSGDLGHRIRAHRVRKEPESCRQKSEPWTRSLGLRKTSCARPAWNTSSWGAPRSSRSACPGRQAVPPTRFERGPVPGEQGGGARHRVTPETRSRNQSQGAEHKVDEPVQRPVHESLFSTSRTSEGSQSTARRACRGPSSRSSREDPRGSPR